MARLIDVPIREILPLIRALSDAGFDSALTAILRKPGNAMDAVELLHRHFQPELQADGASPPRTAFLDLMYQEESLMMIAACNGQETLAQAKDLFHDVDPAFKNWNTDKAGHATPATQAVIYQLVEDATFASMFTSLSGKLSKLCLTQAQIKQFVRVYSNSLLQPDTWFLFFLFEVEGNHFVAYVHRRPWRDAPLTLCANVYHFGDEHVWYANSGHRLVIPQLQR